MVKSNISTMLFLDQVGGWKRTWRKKLVRIARLLSSTLATLLLEQVVVITIINMSLFWSCILYFDWKKKNWTKSPKIYVSLDYHVDPMFYKYQKSVGSSFAKLGCLMFPSWTRNSNLISYMKFRSHLWIQRGCFNRMTSALGVEGCTFFKFPFSWKYMMPLLADTALSLSNSLLSCLSSILYYHGNVSFTRYLHCSTTRLCSSELHSGTSQVMDKSRLAHFAKFD